MESFGRVKKAWHKACSPPDRRPIYEWAADSIRLPNAYTLTGRYDPYYSRRFLDILDALKSDTVRNVVVMKPVRGGGTMIADLWLPWVVPNDPGPFMWLMQSDQIAKMHAETRLHPILENCEPVKPFYAEDRHASRKLEIMFRHGMYLGISGPGINKLQSRGVRYLFMSEIWLPEWAGKVEEALGRTKDFRAMRMDKVFMESQAGHEGDDIDLWFHKGTMKEWTIPCLKCGHKMVGVKWQNKRADGSRWGIVWEESKTKAKGEPFDLRKAQESIRFECEKCAYPHIYNDRTLREWNRLGEYQQTNENANPSIESFRWPGFIHHDWNDLLEMFHSAMKAFKQGNLDPLKIFFQKYIPESWSESKAHQASPLQTVGFNVKSKWEDEYARFMTIDVQDESLFYWVVRAWARNGESRRLSFGKAFSYSELNAIQTEWSVAGPNVLIDSGFDTKTVYWQAAKHDWTATKGDNVPFYLHDVPSRSKERREKVRKSYTSTHGDPERGTEGEGRKLCFLVRYSDITLQWRTHRLINGQGAKWVIPEVAENDDERTYRKHLFSEYPKKVLSKKTGKVEWVFVCPSGENHWRDCEKLQTLAATIADCLIDSVDEEKRSSENDGEG